MEVVRRENGGWNAEGKRLGLGREEVGTRRGRVWGAEGRRWKRSGWGGGDKWGRR